MKLIFENWKNYLSECEKTEDLGHLYLFENESVTKTSFYDAIHLLNENEDSIESFLEKWDRSVDYQLNQLDENAMIDFMNQSDEDVKAAIEKSPIGGLAKQAFAVISKLGKKAVKYADKILAVVDKIKAFLERFKEKHPILYKIGKMLIRMIIVFLVMQAIIYIMGAVAAAIGGGALASAAGSAQGAMLVNTSGEVIANADQLRAIAEAASNIPGLAQYAEQILQIANNADDIVAGIGIAADIPDAGPLMDIFNMHYRIRI